MFDDHSAYQLHNPIKKSTAGINGEKRSYFYKVRANTKKAYIIRVDEYEHKVFFIKFYPKQLEQSPNKYKHRFPNTSESLPRLVITCIHLAWEIKKKNPKAVFGFHGQWDEVDNSRKRKTSQRFDIYLKVVLSKITRETFKHVTFEGLNVHFMIPTELYSDEFMMRITKYFEGLYGKRLTELVIPSRLEN